MQTSPDLKLGFEIACLTSEGGLTTCKVDWREKEAFVDRAAPQLNLQLESLVADHISDYVANQKVISSNWAVTEKSTA